MKSFDNLEKKLFNTLNRHFGNKSPVVWMYSDGSIRFSGIVFFNDPTVRAEVDGVTYTDESPYIEYLVPAFAGLKELVDEGASNERLIINSQAYTVMKVDRLDDGNNIKAFLQLVR